MAAINSIILYKLKYPDSSSDELRARRESLEIISVELIKPLIEMRNEKLKANNYKNINNSVRDSIKKCGYETISKSLPLVNGK